MRYNKDKKYLWMTEKENSDCLSICKMMTINLYFIYISDVKYLLFHSSNKCTFFKLVQAVQNSVLGDAVS